MNDESTRQWKTPPQVAGYHREAVDFRRKRRGIRPREEIKSEIDLIVFMSPVFKRQQVLKERVRTLIRILQI